MNNPRPLGTVKDAAYAWRHMIFYLSIAGDQAHQPFLSWSLSELESARPDVRHRLRPALNGLLQVVNGGDFTEDGEAPNGKRFLGWAVGGHWMLGSEVLPRHVV